MKTRIAVVALLGLSQMAAADSMRCGTDIIGIGDSVDELLAKCGEPLRKQGNEWVYQLSASSAPPTVRIANERVQQIETPLENDL